MSNLRRRVFVPVVTQANDTLIAAGLTPLPVGLTPHKMRHTFASLLIANGDDPAYVMDQLGHADPGFTLRLYTHAMRRDARDGDCRQALVSGTQRAPIDTRPANGGRVGPRCEARK